MKLNKIKFKKFVMLCYIFDYKVCNWVSMILIQLKVLQVFQVNIYLLYTIKYFQIPTPCRLQFPK